MSVDPLDELDHVSYVPVMSWPARQELAAAIERQGRQSADEIDRERYSNG